MPKEKKTKHTILSDPFDIQAFDGIMEESTKLQEQLEESKLKTVRHLAQDVFSSVYKYLPTLKEEEEIHYGYLFNRSLMERAMETKEWERLRAMTKLHDVESAIATDVILKVVLENVSDEDVENVNDYLDASNAYQKAQEQLDAIDEVPQDQQTPQMQQAKKKLRKQLPKLQGAAKDTQAGMDQACQNPAMRSAMRQALDQARQDLDEANEFFSGWGLNPGELHSVPPQERMRLMRMLIDNEKIKQLVKILGRFKRLALQKRQTRVTREPSEVVGIEQGDDISRVLPSELVDLIDEDREILFFKKLLGGELLQYKLEGKEKMGRGPIIMLVDTSGSMWGDREIWAKGVALAMADIALRDKRNIEVICFSSRTEIAKFVIEKGIDPVERIHRLVDIATYNFGGGTDFEEPLEMALADIDTQEFKKADIVMVTDGECDFSDEFLVYYNEVKKKKDFRMHTVLVGCTSYALKKVSDDVHELWDILREGERVAGELFEVV